MFRVLAHIIRFCLRPRILFVLIPLWYKSPNPWRLFKEFLSDNLFISAFVYGVLTACVALYCYSAQDITALICVIFESFLLLLSYPLILALFCRIHYRNSPRINWHKTLAPAKDMFVIWFITVLFTCLVGLFVIFISKK